jgi:NADH-quinone oxidoreductase subunit N
LIAYLPEFLIVGLIILALIVDLPKKGQDRPTGTICLIGLVFVFKALLGLWAQGTQTVIFSGMVTVDPLSTFFKMLFVGAAFITVLIAGRSRELEGASKGEFYALILGVTLGMMLLASARNLLMIYLGIETTSMLSYCLAGYLQKNRRSAESSLKYVLYGAVASGVMIYGMALLYGLSGTLDLAGISKWVATSHAGPTDLVFFLSFVFILVGLAYKIAAAPFHMWSPDVYEGSPIVATAFFSVGPKLAGFAVLIRFLCTGLFTREPGTFAWPMAWDDFAGLNWTMEGTVLPVALLLAAISAITMTLGNLSALRQDNIKRLLAYSSIAHSGYALMGLVLLNGQGLVATCLYLSIYLIMNLGVFLVAIMMHQTTGSEALSSYRGLVWNSPLVAIAMAIFLFSLTGLPPSAGFIGKVHLFGALINEAQSAAPSGWANALYVFVLTGVLNSVISFYYYARIIKAMFLTGQPKKKTRIFASHTFTALLITLAIPTVLFGIWWSPLYTLASKAILGLI